MRFTVCKARNSALRKRLLAVSYGTRCNLKIDLPGRVTRPQYPWRVCWTTDRVAARIDGKACGAYVAVVGPSIICFIKSMAASAVGWPQGVAMYSASVSV
jgi:hypothetical protein